MILRKTWLRYAIVDVLMDAGRPMRVAAIVDRLVADGFGFTGRPGKCVSDALRTEVGLGRARRVTRGWYAAGDAPDTTRRRIRKTMRQLRAQSHLPAHEVVVRVWR